MVDFRPFNALRYDTSVAGEAASLVAPPYDVVSPAQIADLHGRNRYNIAHVDYGDTRPGDTATENRYKRSKVELDRWRSEGALKVDPVARLYVYDQEFEVHGETHRRRAIFGRLRIADWDERSILPHEHTRAREKEDRYHLLEATRVNLSPIMAMYDSTAVADALKAANVGEPVLDAKLPNERHTLRPLSDEAASRIHDALTDERLYIADGHHRYEVALGYRNERKAAVAGWTGDEPENFVLAALVDANDPGLVILPIHRLLKLDRASLKPLSALDGPFEVHEWTGNDDQAVSSLAQAVAAAGTRGSAFGLIGFETGKLHLVTVKDAAAVAFLMPADVPDEWSALDVAVLHHAVFPTLGFVDSPETVAFTEDHLEAAKEVREGVHDAAVLLNPTRADQVIAVADGGERMPQKSTFFFPKLGTGIVMLPLD